MPRLGPSARRLGLYIGCLAVAVLTTGCRGKQAGDVRRASTSQFAKSEVVGCPADGQQGPEFAPKDPKVPSVQVPSAVAKRLAFYQGAYGLGVLAPWGWHCLNLEGSSGDYILVTPQPIAAEQLFSEDFKGIEGPGVQLSGSDAGTSGRFEVAEMIRRVFPAHEAFADGVISEGIRSAHDMPKGPYPADTLSYRSKEWVDYTTPPNAQGLGTSSQLKAGSAPISGFVMLAGSPEEYDLVHLAVRLASTDVDLATIISNQAADEAGKGTR